VLLRDWLRSGLKRGGWNLADRAPRHGAIERLHDWRAASAQPVLVGVVRRANAQQHRDWILNSRLYYMPKLEHQSRQFLVARVALYVPMGVDDDRDSGGVTHAADVESIDLVPRRDIATPWPASRPDQLQICYRLGAIHVLEPPIINQSGGRRRRMSAHRWTSMLALHRARELQELLLETEPEWRLLETLRAHGAAFSLDPERPGVIDAENPHGRTWFEIDARRARYAGASGFLLQEADKLVASFADWRRACEFLLGP
jgi:hypothetical protein